MYSCKNEARNIMNTFLKCMHYVFNNKFSPILFQNFLNESLKFLDKMVPNNSHISGLHSVASVSSSLETKPLHLDAKSLLNHGSNNSNSSSAAAAVVTAAIETAIDNKETKLIFN